ncbi:MAG: hypothetical protein HYY51_01715 [Candidatus Magasanikbacteria bacterium]|nr:hypothetical protein [Candidatus Magasanikbacteria bacterium]
MKSLNLHYLFLFAVISFVLHIFWENIQAPLYTGFVSFPDHFIMCLRGALGDVVISIGALFFIILVKRTEFARFNWTDFIALAILGFLVAILVEQHAIITGRWSYGSEMPIISYLRVGLAPIVQMTFLLPFSSYLAQKLSMSLEKVDSLKTSH